ncbi:hypothetical protein SLEP1_g2975 [Rubroshorea leprosula]|uniref:Uncharacterized protein n=1 Tax=Rubroshorea leprosula TaxID=152421 RepID=A0AAV5HTG7_9ROSI|nr:hypothetical protein SLEP1_g2975 [Rubroshorea leprosula]
MLQVRLCYASPVLRVKCQPVKASRPPRDSTGADLSRDMTLLATHQTNAAKLIGDYLVLVHTENQVGTLSSPISALSLSAARIELATKLVGAALVDERSDEHEGDDGRVHRRPHFRDGRRRHPCF